MLLSRTLLLFTIIVVLMCQVIVVLQMTSFQLKSDSHRQVLAGVGYQPFIRGENNFEELTKLDNDVNNLNNLPHYHENLYPKSGRC